MYGFWTLFWKSEFKDRLVYMQDTEGILFLFIVHFRPKGWTVILTWFKPRATFNRSKHPNLLLELFCLPTCPQPITLHMVGWDLGVYLSHLWCKLVPKGSSRRRHLGHSEGSSHRWCWATPGQQIWQLAPFADLQRIHHNSTLQGAFVSTASGCERLACGLSYSHTKPFSQNAIRARSLLIAASDDKRSTKTDPSIIFKQKMHQRLAIQPTASSGRLPH